ncbi:MAG: hypothetical protein KDK97_12865, partial [Verrucomicrobiales bacterium]|nr:hypothetical protein [Verrucomicrobiales bacterium]
EIHAQVPVEFVGECEGVRLGGLLEIHHHTVEVHCLPKDLPASITIDATPLGLGAAVHIRDLPLPANVRAHLDGDVIVAIVAEPKVAEVATPGAAAAAPAAAAAAPAKK